MEVWKASILLQTLRVSECEKLLRKICSWQPPITDLKILDRVYVLENCCSEAHWITAGPDVGGLFDSAAAAGGRQFGKAVYDILFLRGASHGKWGDAQRVSGTALVGSITLLSHRSLHGYIFTANLLYPSTSRPVPWELYETSSVNSAVRPFRLLMMVVPSYLGKR